jgi:Ca2+-binding RTX toxin-like protein
MPSKPKTTRRVPAILPAALVAMLVAAAPAHASRVAQDGDSLEYDAGGGEVNGVSVTISVSGSGRVTTTISDTAGISPSGGCSHDRGNRQVVTCTSGRDDSIQVDLDLGDGDDSLRVVQRDPGRAPAVRISDGSGDDVITVNHGATTWVNGTGHDIYRGGAGRDVALPGDGEDFILGGWGNDVIDGGDGHDQLSGNVGNDRLDGGIGFDLVEGNAGDDAARGGPDGDFVFGGSGNDRLDGDSGFDRLFGGPGADVVDGGRTQDNRSG